MLNKSIFNLFVFVVIFMLISAISCSDSNNITGDDGLDITLSSYTELVEAIAPPLYDNGGAAKTAVIDSIWTEGEYALLGKVFGEDEPMSLYRNLATLDDQIDMINEMLASDQDSITEEQGGETYHGYFQITELTDPVEIPLQAQAILGNDPIDLDYRVNYGVTELPEMALEAAFSIDTTEETVLCYQRMPTSLWDSQYPDGTESNLFLAHRDLTTDSIYIKCVFFKDYGDSTSAIWGYEIMTIGTSDFQYRMSWYSNEESVPDGFLGAIIGGGNKDELFALRYQGYHPVDTLYDDISQLFGINYSDEGDITTAFEDYVDDALFFMYDDLPTEILTNPLEGADLINPWGNQ
jgi:hypothetical protein